MRNAARNQITIANRVLVRNKVASFIITGGQDNVQAVAGQMLGFFAEIGCHFPQFPYIAHSRGWTAEDMERNVDMAQLLLDHETAPHTMARGGRRPIAWCWRSWESTRAKRLTPMATSRS
jgi:hypothetical protein